MISLVFNIKTWINHLNAWRKLLPKDTITRCSLHRASYFGLSFKVTSDLSIPGLILSARAPVSDIICVFSFTMLCSFFCLKVKLSLICFQYSMRSMKWNSSKQIRSWRPCPRLLKRVMVTIGGTHLLHQRSWHSLYYWSKRRWNTTCCGLSLFP